MANTVTMWLSFSGGLLAFFSPCTLPLYPSFISFITGVSVKELEQSKHKGVTRSIFIHSLLFVIGFSLIYFALGFSASMLGQFFYEYNDTIRMVGAVFIGVMGLFLLGIFQPRLLLKEFRLPFIKKRGNVFTSFLVGFIFAAGWTPCIGPIFSAIIYANVAYPGQVFINITAYAIGFGLPFILMGLFFGKLKWVNKYSSWLMKMGGALLLAIAILLYTDKMTYINIWFQQLTNFQM